MNTIRRGMETSEVFALMLLFGSTWQSASFAKAIKFKSNRFVIQLLGKRSQKHTDSSVVIELNLI